MASSGSSSQARAGTPPSSPTPPVTLSKFAVKYGVSKPGSGRSMLTPVQRQILTSGAVFADARSVDRDALDQEKFQVRNLPVLSHSTLALFTYLTFQVKSLINAQSVENL